MKKLLTTAALLLASAAAMPASAQSSATITISGDFGGIFNGSPFAPQHAVFTGLTDNYQSAFLGYTADFTSLTAYSTLNGTPVTFDFGSGYSFSSFLGLFNSVGYVPDRLFSYSLNTLDTPSTRDFQTQYGTVQILSGSNIVTDIKLDSAVPEPATWAMMVLGFGMVGYGVRRRAVTAKVSFA